MYPVIQAAFYSLGIEALPVLALKQRWKLKSLVIDIKKIGDVVGPC